MPTIRAFLVVTASALFLIICASEAFPQGTDTFTVMIPSKGPNGREPTSSEVIPIGVVKAIVGLSTSNPVTFTFLDQSGTNSISIGPCTPSGCTAPTSKTYANPESGSAGPDQITVIPTSEVGDPVRYEIDFVLNSNHASSNSCRNTLQQNAGITTNSYKVTISPSTTNKIVGVCLESFDGRYRSIQQNFCAGGTNGSLDKNEIPVPPVGNDIVATVDVDPFTQQPSFVCYKAFSAPGVTTVARPDLNVAMVLDKSGSMGTIDSGQTGTRMDGLHSSVSTFLTDWTNLSPPMTDKVGVVTFDTTSTSRTSLTGVVANGAAVATDVQNNVTPGGWTAIGSGLATAANNNLAAAASGSRKAILLMSDGQQNQDPFVNVTNGQVTLYCNDPSKCTSLPPPSGCAYTLASPCPLSTTPLQIYTVTVGPSAAVDPGINQAIGNAGHGYYLNSETNPTATLDAFFVQLLQNFVRFNSYETVRLISEHVSSTTRRTSIFPISTTSHDVVFTLMWPKQLGPLRLTVNPPGAQPIVTESASGLISFVQELPLQAPFDPRGDWNAVVDVPPVVGVTATAGGGDIPFDLHVMTDDAGIKSELAVVPSDYKVGDNIRLRAKLANFGIPILGMGTHTGDAIKVDLVAPGNSVGDALSDSSASPDPPPSRLDLQRGADAKLFNMLQANPAELKHVTVPGIQLYDDGKPEHGDDVAGDGIYSALYPAVLPGHYNFLFSVESTDPKSVRFSRQQLRTAYVRAVPDRDNTLLTSRIDRNAKGGTLSITFTPRVKPGPGCLKNDPKCGRMGPGWANYFWFTSPGQTPFKPTESPNFDGTYTATLPFTGSAPPPVDFHFEDVLAVIGDTVPPDKLPQPLDSGNVVVHNCCKPSHTAPLALFLDFGGNFPHPDFSKVFDNGFSFNAGLEYALVNNWALESIFGYHRFFGKTLPGGTVPDLNVYQFSANLKYYALNGKLGGHPARLFFNFGPGGYKFSSADTYFGGNVGAGVLIEPWNRLGFQFSYNFHAVKTPVDAKTPWGTTEFSTAQAGIRFMF